MQLINMLLIQTEIKQDKSMEKKKDNCSLAKCKETKIPKITQTECDTHFSNADIQNM